MHQRGRGQPHLTSKEKERVANIAFRMEQSMSGEDKVKIERGTATLSAQIFAQCSGAGNQSTAGFLPHVSDGDVPRE